MIVSKRMTPNPTTITSAMTIVDALQIMRSNKFRRLPVVDNGKLVGIVTDRDLREVSASPATSLSVFELNYLLSKMQVKDIMAKKVLTVSAEATVEEAALIMYNHKIGGLVVMDQNQQVVGILTETDIFKTFVDIMGLPQGKTRLSIVVPDRLGVVHDISGVFKEFGISIGSFASYPTDEGQYEVVIRADIKDVKAFTERLAAVGYPVQHVVQIG
ncbi:CBS and ACT domain-containing protein [Sporomusa sphaeroides]|uniref:Inosine-5'-monophosphate dehydrogenase n=2 Tax=Sporomusa TaxID=2375 RepID=A0ABM9W0A4_9FIRM|nr:CBS and ACT domain-containing protein [Sporomusa sphaeroides]OLS56456.1 inosine-5'-monophosphate dehydrogenase [Sporomusa sphaeroides DSM 2875]CVK18551.1 Inosine-5'-monophosphate dehydrogenase [Sporomusa sphaeroides DSM 2875]SCM82289.1 Signal-transduction protein [uncultured Sporomusa sp.]